MAFLPLPPTLSVKELISITEKSLAVLRAKKSCAENDRSFFQELLNPDGQCYHEWLSMTHVVTMHGMPGEALIQRHRTGMAFFIYHEKILLPILHNLDEKDATFALDLVQCFRGIFGKEYIDAAICPRIDEELDWWDPRIMIKSRDPKGILDGLFSLEKYSSRLLHWDEFRSSLSHTFRTHGMTLVVI